MTDRADDAALPLDALLVEAARGPLRRLLPAGPAARLAGALLRRPTAGLARGAGLLAELGRIGLGSRPAAGPNGDPRHADAAWAEDPLLSRLVLAHRAARDSALELVGDLATDPVDAERLRFAVGRLGDLLAPGTNPLLQPRNLRVAEAGRTAKALAEDLAAAPRLPGGRAPEPGVETAAAPGAVVLRTPLFELLHFLPSTEHVAEVPVLVVPGFANPYHLVDLTPDHSLVRHLVGAGLQVLAVSWRSPGPPEAGQDAYAAALDQALAAAARICRTDRVSLFGFGGGGPLAVTLTARLGRPERVASLVLAGTVLDTDQAATVDEGTLSAAVAGATRRGTVDGRRLAELHALLCPDALVWPAWQRRYLDHDDTVDPLRAWNLDARDVPAALYRDLVAFTLPRGRPDLSAVDRELYVVAGVADRVGGWHTVYRTTQATAAKARFVLVPGSTAAAMGYGSATHRVGPGPVSAGNPADPERWRAASHVEPGSWWDDLAGWLTERSGAVVDAPPELGGRGLHPMLPAPGSYLAGR